MPGAILEKDVLEECCANRLPVTVLEPHGLHRGRFAALNRDVTIDLSSLRWKVGLSTAVQPWPGFIPSSVCTAFFGHQTGSAAFLGSVKSYDHSRRRLVLEPLTTLVKVEARRAWRIPLHKGAGLLVHLSREGKGYSPRAVNISLTGILVEFPRDEVPDLDVGTLLDLELRLQDRSVELRTEVRRRDKDCYGLFFTDSVGEGRVTVPEPLNQIVNSLEKDWLRRRIG